MPRLRPIAQSLTPETKARPHDQPQASRGHRRRRAHRDDAQRPPGRLRPAPAARPRPPSTAPTASGTEISASGIARAAGVDRTFLYRHRDLLEKIHAPEAAPPPAGDTAGPAVTRASLQADLLAAHERAIRLNTRVRQLEKRLSDALGEQAWRESGLGAPADIDALSQKITHLEQQATDLRLQLEERGDELAAARAANRELMTQLNHSAATR